MRGVPPNHSGRFKVTTPWLDQPVPQPGNLFVQRPDCPPLRERSTVDRLHPLFKRAPPLPVGQFANIGQGQTAQGIRQRTSCQIGSIRRDHSAKRKSLPTTVARL